MSELYDKASRAWFAISNVLYKYKRLPVNRAFQLFDSLIRPIALVLVFLDFSPLDGLLLCEVILLSVRTAFLFLELSLSFDSSAP